MNNEMYEIMKDKRGFIAALDQSGGSSSKTLKAYGIPETAYNTEEEMFDLIHEMRKRVFTSKSFTNEHIIGAILLFVLIIAILIIVYYMRKKMKEKKDNDEQ